MNPSIRNRLTNGRTEGRNLTIKTVKRNG